MHKSVPSGLAEPAIVCSSCCPRDGENEILLTRLSAPICSSQKNVTRSHSPLIGCWARSITEFSETAFPIYIASAFWPHTRTPTRMISLGTNSGSMGLEFIISLARRGLGVGLSCRPISQPVVLYLIKYFHNLTFLKTQSRYHLHFMD